jgi:hypothetical protein
VVRPPGDVEWTKRNRERKCIVPQRPEPLMDFAVQREGAERFGQESVCMGGERKVKIARDVGRGSRGRSGFLGGGCVERQMQICLQVLAAVKEAVASSSSSSVSARAMPCADFSRRARVISSRVVPTLSRLGT